MNRLDQIQALGDMIVFADDWGRQPSSCQHLMKRFLPNNRVFWVNSIGLRSPKLSKYDFIRFLGKLKSWSLPESVSETNLKVISPVSLPWNHIEVIRKMNKAFGLSKLKRVTEAKGSLKRISLTTVPNACDWVGNLGESLKVYYCTDDYTLWPGAHRETVIAMEKELLSKIDLFVGVSEKLIELKKPKGIPSLLLPHAVDSTHFQQALKPLSPEERLFSFPAIGFFGTIDERIDFELVQFLAEQRPDLTLVFIGPLQYFPESLKRKKNIRFLPQSDYMSLPNTLRQLDLLFLPYKVNPLIQQSNPLKLRECLATGKPVLAVSVSETQKYADDLKVGQNKEQILDFLKEILEDYSSWKSDKQIQRMNEETWEDRAMILAEKIKELL